MLIAYDVAELFGPLVPYFVGKLWNWSDVTITISKRRRRES